MVKKISTLFLILIFLVTGCGATYSNNEKITGYNLSKPDRTSIMPYILHEISGLTMIDSGTFACIQDEDGILFIYDEKSNVIKHQYTFNIPGDYEGITRVGNTMYVLRSDGVLFEISDYTSKNFKLKMYDTGIPANNNEGLCYDPDNNRLLIACKGKIGKGSELKDKRVIYGFDLETRKLSDTPVFEFDLQTIKDFAGRNNSGIPVKSRKKKGLLFSEPLIKFSTSAICIHPVTKKLYLLSAADHLLFVFSMKGILEHIESLNPTLFNKAEGITFMDNGDMLISNEGQDRHPTLLYFRYRK